VFEQLQTFGRSQNPLKHPPISSQSGTSQRAPVYPVPAQLHEFGPVQSPCAHGGLQMGISQLEPLNPVPEQSHVSGATHLPELQLFLRVQRGVWHCKSVQAKGVQEQVTPFTTLQVPLLRQAQGCPGWHE
jgi:hypothetical protein